MLNIEQFRENLIKPVLSSLQMYSKDAEELLVFTCAAESHGGTYLKQINGPALGIFQCEPQTHNDIWYNFLRHRTSLVTLLSLNFNINPGQLDPARLVYDLNYATVIARLHYRREKQPLPSHDDVEAIYDYYKEHYNTVKGKSVKDKCIKAYELFSGTSR